MAHGDNPADRYNHRNPAERDRERPTGHHDDQRIERHRADGSSDSDPDRQTGRDVVDHAEDFRAGAGGAPGDSAGAPGNTLGTQGSIHEQDR